MVTGLNPGSIANPGSTRCPKLPPPRWVELVGPVFDEPDEDPTLEA
jgi:hypothetical protein